MELRHLRGFMAVAQEQSFTRAAQRLHIAQPPLSQRIRQLEEELSVQLFDRHTRKVTLSAAGQILFEELEKVFAQLDLALEACRRASRGEAGHLKLGYGGRASHLLLPRLLLALRTSIPDVELDLVGPLPSGVLQTQLLDEQIDLAICLLPRDKARIHTRPFAKIDFMLVLPATHPLAGKQKIPLALLANESFVGYPSGKGFTVRDVMDAECERAGFRPRVVRESETSKELMYLVAAGTGVSIVPRELQRQTYISGVVFKSLGRGAYSLSHGLAWLSDNTNPALHSLLALDLYAG